MPLFQNRVILKEAIFLIYFNMSEIKFLDLAYQQAKLTRYLDSLGIEAKSRAFRALSLAEEAHWGQFRNEGVSYIIHPVRTTLILVEEIGIEDVDLLCAALLHDVIEDGGVVVEHLETLFGKEIALIVQGVSRKKPTYETEEEKKLNKRKKIDEIAKAGEKVRLIKLCDVLDNARSQKYISQNSLAYQKIPRWRQELALYLPIAQQTNLKLLELLSAYKEEI